MVKITKQRNFDTFGAVTALVSIETRLWAGQAGL